MLGFIINIMVQIVTVPLYLKYWGVSRYGDWLIIFSIPSFIGLSDLGLGTAVNYQLVKLLSTNNYIKANKLLNSSFYFIFSLSTFTCLIFIAVMFIFPLHVVFGFKFTSIYEFRITFIILSIYVLLSIVLTLPLGLYRSIGIFSRGQILGSLFKGIEFFSIVVLVFLGGSFITVSIIYLVIRICFILTILKDISIKAPWIKLLKPFIDFKIISPLFKSSFSFMAISFGQALSGQGLIFLVGSNGSSLEVVMFSTIRTFINVFKQIVGFINNSFWGEISIAYANNNKDLFQNHIKKLYHFNIFFSLLGAIILYLFGINIINIWTHSSFVVDTYFFYLMIISIVIENSYTSNWSVLMSINQHKKTTIPYLASVFFSLLVSNFIYFKIGLIIIPLSLIFGSLILFFYFKKLNNSILFQMKGF